MVDMDEFSATMNNVAVWYLALPLFPIFEIVHYFKVAMVARSEKGAKEFAVRYPLSSCVSTLLLGVGGTIAFNLLLGRPLGEVLFQPHRLALAAAAWYAVFFSPWDIVHTLLSTTLSKIFIVAMKDMRRVRQVYSGVQVALQVHPNSWLLAIVAGTAKGSGTRIMLTLDRFLRGGEQQHDHELLKPTFHTKACFASACFLMAQHSGLVHLSTELTLVLAVTIMIAGSLSVLLLGMPEPFGMIGGLVYRPLFGRPAPEEDATEQDSETKEKKE